MNAETADEAVGRPRPLPAAPRRDCAPARREKICGGARRSGDPKKGEPLNERLQSDACVKMLGAAFGGYASQTRSIIEIIEKIDLARDPPRSPSSASRMNRPTSSEGTRKRPRW